MEGVVSMMYESRIAELERKLETVESSNAHLIQHQADQSRMMEELRAADKEKIKTLNDKILSLQEELATARLVESNIPNNENQVCKKCQELEKELHLHENCIEERKIIRNEMTKMKEEIRVLYKEISQSTGKEKTGMNEAKEVIQQVEPQKKFIVVHSKDELTCLYNIQNVECINYNITSGLYDLKENPTWYQKELFVLADWNDVAAHGCHYTNFLNICRQWRKVRGVDGEIHVVLPTSQLAPNHTVNEIKSLSTSFKQPRFSYSDWRTNLTTAIAHCLPNYSDLLLSERMKLLYL